MTDFSILESYVPREVCYALAAGQALNRATRGAALFADISGFTPLTAAFTEEYGATRGAEEMVRHLERVFDLIVGAVHRHGGSIISFAGDAVTCWFEAIGEDNAEAALRATAAATAMRDALSGFTIQTSQGLVFPIAVKAAVSAGAAKRFIVGSPDIRRLEVIAGDTVNRMANAEQLSKGGEVIVSAEVAEALGTILKVSEWRESDSGHRCAIVSSISESVAAWEWPPAPQLSAVVLRPWLDRDIFEQIEHGQANYLGAFRRVAALFLRFDGLEFDSDPEVEPKLDAFVRRVQSVLATYEGHIIDLNIGDKGSYLSSAFGALREYEDLARRAVTAAQELSRLAENQAGIRSVSIGVAYAQVYAGSYGCAQRRTFSMMGPQVIIAARLMSKAGPSQVLVTPEIAANASRTHHFEAQPPTTLKGFEGPFQAHLLAGERDHRLATADLSVQMVGRLKELEILQGAVPKSGQAGQRAARLVIEGEAGIGKTTLIGALVRTAGNAGVRVLRGGAEAIHRSSQYHVWRSIFENIVGLDTVPKTSPDRLALRTRACLGFLASLGDGSERLAPLLNPVLGLSLDDNEATRSMQGSVRADNTADLMLRMLRAQQGSFVLVLEDMHWFDSASTALLRLVAGYLDSALVVVTRRPITDSSQDAEVSPDARVLRLGPLSDEEATTLLQNALAVDSVSLDITRWICRKAEGSPFFSRELAFALRDTGVLEIADGQCRLAHGIEDLDTLDFPDTIQGVIASRLDQLSTQQQMAVKVASVIGRIFAVRLLRDVHPIEQDKPSLPTSLSGLEKAQIAHEEPEAPELSYLFNHVLTQEVAYGRLLHEQRSLLHRRVGEWLEQHPSGDRTSDLPLLAHHFSQALRESAESGSLRSKALGYLGQAGTQALHAYMNREAVRFFSEAIELAASGDEGEPALWHAGLAHAYMALGEFPAAQKHGRIAFRLIGSPFPESAPGLLANSLALLGRVIWRMIGRRSMFPAINTQVRLADPDWQPHDPMQLLRVFAKSLYHKNDALGMLCANLRSLNLAEQSGPGPEMALSYGHAMMTLDVFRMPRHADAFGTRAIEIAKAAKSPETLVAVYIARAMVHLSHANWKPARNAYELAREVAAELGDDWQWGEAQAMLADMALIRGDIEQATQLYSDLEENAERRDTAIQKAWCMRPLVIRELDAGRAQAALELLKARLPLLDRVPDPLIRIDALGFKALAHVMLGEDEAALEPIAEAHRMIPALSPPVAYPRYFGYRALGQACLTLYERNPKSRSHRKNAAFATRYVAGYANGFAYARPRASLLRGWVLAIKGRMASARQTIQRGIAEAESLGIQPDLALGRALLERFDGR